MRRNKLEKIKNNKLMRYINWVGGINDGKNTKLELIKMSDVPLEEIDWLWYPYIAYGKITIMHGNPGDGKTNIALKIASQCSIAVNTAVRTSTVNIHAILR